jgi:TonB-dependent starch-binding outer membrane protein SusC
MTVFKKRLPGSGFVPLFLMLLLLLIYSTAMAYDPLKGVVAGADGRPLEGVTISVKGNNTATTTAADGSFTINAARGAVLIVSMVGYETRQVTLSQLARLSIVLQEKVNTMDNVVVVGYGTQNKKDLTGAIASISEKDMEKGSIRTPDQALQGKVAGVQVRTNSHAPGGGIAVQIRGTASLSAGGSPLYVIDGIPISNDFRSGRSTDAGTFGAQANPMNSIDPSDIASIQVLKDASASAIYGSRAANGVVLITTKRGRANEHSINLEYSMGIRRLSNKLKFLDATQWAQQANERAKLLGQAPVYTDQQIAAFGTGTDWQDEVFRTAPQNNYKLSFSGGTSNVRYMLAGNVSNQQGIVRGSDFKRYGATINVDADINKRLKIGENLMFTVTDNNIVPTDTKGYEGVSNVIDAIFEAPATIAARDSAGQPVVLANHPLGGGRENPLLMTDKYRQLAKTDRLIGSVFANYNLMRGLDFNLRMGVDLNNWRWNEYFPIGSEASAGSNGRARQMSSRNINLSNASTLTYQTSINDIHQIKVLGGFTYQKEKFESVDASSFGFPSDIFEYYNLGLGSSPQSPGSNTYEWSLVSYLGRVNYTLLDKYLLTASVRTDGDSKFGKNNKYGVFPSVSLAWQLTKEKFINDLDLFSQLKLRASYGKTGNESIGVYRSLSLLATAAGTRSSYVINGAKVPIAYPQNLANPDLSWEKTGEYNAGLDMGFAKDRVTLSADYYYKKTTDLLLDVPVPAQTGFNSVLMNTGAMLNRGFEFGVNSANLTGLLKWNTNFNISFNRNKVLSLGGAPYLYTGWVGGGNVTPHDKNTSRLQPGHSVGEFYGSVYEGVWKSKEEITRLGTMPSAKPGDIRYKDVNGDGKYDTENDDLFLGSPNPDFNFGLTNELSYKQWNLHLFAYGEYGSKILNLAAQQLALDGQGPSARRLQRWTPENPDAWYPSAAASNPQRVSSIMVEDGSFLRIGNVSLGYNLPVKGLLGGKVLKTARLGAGIDNLAVFTNYSGYDPEVNAFGNSNTVKGMDRFGYPPSRVYRFNVQLGF